MDAHRRFSPRRIGVCGSSRELPRAAIPFCEAAGTRLARERHVVIVSGGARRREHAAHDDLAADWHIVNAAARALAQLPDRMRAEERIETVVSDAAHGAESFTIGTVRRARGRTREARRFSFARGVDALLAVGGGGGTAQELALAGEMGVPVLPVPCFGGTARVYWDAYRRDIIDALRIDDETAVRWEGAPTDDPERVAALADEMVAVLVASLPRRCFVIMPFDEEFTPLYDLVIERAVAEVGDEPIHLQRDAVPGDAGRQIHDGIRRCDYAVVVLDGLRHNVLYELGLAHGHGRPTVLLNRKGALGDDTLAPFDISMQQRLEYEALDARLVQQLRDALRALVPRRG